MSLETPIKIRMLQRKLYQKAKGEPNYRFYLLYDKMYREDILAHAYALVKSNQGAPGVDGQTFWGIETLGLEEWLNGIRMDLRGKTYQPQAVRRVMIPKPGGGQRLLGIPTIRDRVVQTAAKLLLEPIFEADFDPNAYGYRPKRSAQDAIQKVHELLRKGYTDVVDADLSKYFDNIPHSELLQCVALSWTRGVMERIQLTLNEAKTSIKQALQEEFDFLGYTFGMHRSWQGDWYLAAKPSKKSVGRLRQKVGDLLCPQNTKPWEDVRDQLNRILRGWSNYFSYGTCSKVHRAVDQYVYERVRGFLRRRHKVPSRGTTRFPSAVVFGEMGVMQLVRSGAHSVS